MPQHVINLRKQPSQQIPPQLLAPEPHASLAPPPSPPALPPKEAVSVLEFQNHELENSERIEWSAWEYERRSHGMSWFVGWAGLAAGLIGFGLYTRNYLFVALLFFVAFAFVMSARRGPRFINVMFEKEGIRIGRKFIEWHRIKSFWIFDIPPRKDLSLEAPAGFTHYLRIPLGDADADRIRRALSPMIPEKEHQESLLDEITRIVGF